MQANIQNRTVFTGTAQRDGDCLEVMRGMDSHSIDLIYLDPPFNSKKQWNAPIGSAAEGASFKDRWTYDDIKAEWFEEIQNTVPALYAVIDAAGMTGGKPDKSYLCYMAIRLLEMHRVLKPTGSIYLHCDPVMSHSLKLVMDAIYGAANFRNEIVWGYEKPRPASRKWRSNHDIILFYVGGGEYQFKLPRVPTLAGKFEMRKPFKRPDGTVWTPKEPGKAAGDWWYDIPGFATRMTASERTKYPTQKPLALLERIVAASSNSGEVVLDPFCGCGTACDAAERLKRQWIGIDASALAAKIIKTRLPLASGEIVVRTDLPARTDNEFQLRAAQTDKDYLFGKQGGICNGCRVMFNKRNLTIDHIIPQSKGGQDRVENKQLLCGACNSVKGSRLTMNELRAKLRKMGII